MSHITRGGSVWLRGLTSGGLHSPGSFLNINDYNYISKNLFNHSLLIVPQLHNQVNGKMSPKVPSTSSVLGFLCWANRCQLHERTLWGCKCQPRWSLLTGHCGRTFLSCLCAWNWEHKWRCVCDKDIAMATFLTPLLCPIYVISKHNNEINHT